MDLVNLWNFLGHLIIVAFLIVKIMHWTDEGKHILEQKLWKKGSKIEIPAEGAMHFLVGS